MLTQIYIIIITSATVIDIFLFYSLGKNFADLELIFLYHEYISLFMFFLILLRNYYREKKEILNIKNLYLFSFYIYCLAIIYLDLVGIYPFEKAVLFKAITFDKYEKIKILLIISLSLFGLALGLEIKGFKKKRTNEIKISIKFLKILSISSFFFINLENFNKIKLVMSKGYLALYSDYYKGILGIFNFYIKDLFWASICIMILKNKKLKWPYILAILTILMSALTGKRSDALPYILMLLLVSKVSNNIKISLKKILFLIILLSSLSQIISNFRSGLIISFNPLSVVNEFLLEQSKQYQILGYALKYEFQLTGWGYVFEPFFLYLKNNFFRLIGYVRPLNNTVEILSYTKILGSDLGYLINPKRFLNGEGIGGFAIADLYMDFGLLGVLLGYFIIGYFLKKADIVIKQKSYFSIFIILLIPNIFLHPRLSFLINLFEIEKKIVVLFFIFYGNKIIKKIQNK